MDLTKQAVLAERFENFRLLLALMFVGVGLNNAMEAVRYHYPATDFLWVKIALVVLDIALATGSLLVIVSWFRLRNVTGHLRRLLEEFVQKISATAMVASWIFTFFAVQLISEWTEPDVLFFGTHDAAALPSTKHYMHILVSCMTLSYSLFFLLLYRKSTRGEEA